MSIHWFNRIHNSLCWLKKSNFIKDSIIIGIISGGIGALFMEFVNVLLANNLYFGKIASSMLVHPLRSKRLKNSLLGEIMHLTVGASLGSIISSLLKRTGNDFAISKGIFVSLLAWLGLNNLGNRLNLFRIKPRSTKDHYFALIQHLLYGIATSAVIKYIANPVAFPTIDDSTN